MSTLEIRHVVKAFAGAPLLREVSLTLERGEIVCLLGASGSGKTTLLRIIAGLEQAEHGSVYFDGNDMRGVPVHQREFGLMFQDLALFPHQNVFENVAFGLRMKHFSRAAMHTRVAETLALVGLDGFATRNVNQLSGGEQQRVALARSLAPRPQLLMLDEPLGALDRILREQLIGDLRAILKRIGMTALYVTHDQDEAFALADRIAIVRDGRIVQSGTPEAIYRAPVNAFVARLLGLPNLFHAHLRPDARAETELGILNATTPPSSNPDAIALIRAEHIQLVEPAHGIAARVQECTFHAGKYRVRVITDHEAAVILETDRALAIGATVGLKIDHAELIAPA